MFQDLALSLELISAISWRKRHRNANLLDIYQLKRLEIHTFEFYLLPLWYFYFCLNIRCWNPESDMSKILEKWDVLKTLINSLSKISNSLNSNQSKCGTSFENSCIFDLRKARSVCASAQFNQCLGAPVAQCVKPWPIDGAVLGSSPAFQP